MKLTTAKKKDGKGKEDQTESQQSSASKKSLIENTRLSMMEQANALVCKFQPLARRIAYKIASRLPSNIQVDDLIQAGMIGLIEASRRYDPNLGAGFGTYAGIRIRGEIMDEIRRNDWTPRSVHRDARKISDATRIIENKKGSPASHSEIVEESGLPLKRYHKVRQGTHECRVMNMDPILEAVHGNKDSNKPLENLQKADISHALAESVKKLNVREQKVIELSYSGLNLRETGEVIGVTESRICQHHMAITAKLRYLMQDHF